MVSLPWRGAVQCKSARNVLVILWQLPRARTAVCSSPKAFDESPPLQIQTHTLAKLSTKEPDLSCICLEVQPADRPGPQWTLQPQYFRAALLLWPSPQSSGTTYVSVKLRVPAARPRRSAQAWLAIVPRRRCVHRPSRCCQALAHRRMGGASRPFSLRSSRLRSLPSEKSRRASCSYTFVGISLLLILDRFVRRSASLPGSCLSPSSVSQGSHADSMRMHAQKATGPEGMRLSCTELQAVKPLPLEQQYNCSGGKASILR